MAISYASLCTGRTNPTGSRAVTDQIKGWEIDLATSAGGAANLDARASIHFAASNSAERENAVER
jgi:hypothetical protein